MGNPLQRCAAIAPSKPARCRLRLPTISVSPARIEVRGDELLSRIVWVEGRVVIATARHRREIDMSPIRGAAVGLLAGLLIVPALAQAAPNPANAGPSRAQAAFDRLDTNKDGFIDRQEMRAGRMALFDRLDTSKDGQLTSEEMRAGRRGQRAGTTQQRTISRDEFVARADQSMIRRDTDKDGKLSFAEFSQRKSRTR
jgi:hypothetical protein